MSSADWKSPFFKGWAKPGPIPPGVDDPAAAPEAGESLDAISGYFRLYQLKNGHRFSTDDLLTAWYGTQWVPSARTVLDLGSGIGSVGMIAAWRLPLARFVTVEAQSISVVLARKSARFNGLNERYEIREGDFRQPSVIGAAERFDLVLGSPPYFPLGTGVEGDHPQKVACRFEVRGDISDYCLAASRHLSQGGVFACVFPYSAESLARIHSGTAAAGLTMVRQRPIVLREGNEPLIGVFAMSRSDELPEWFRDQTWVEPPLVIRRLDGSIHPEYSAVKLAIGFPP